MPETSSASASSTQLVVSEPLSATQRKPTLSRASPVTITGRRPVLSERAPASGETTIGVAKKGSRRRPVDSGE